MEFLVLIGSALPFVALTLGDIHTWDEKRRERISKVCDHMIRAWLFICVGLVIAKLAGWTDADWTMVFAPVVFGFAGILVAGVIEKSK